MEKLPRRLTEKYIFSLMLLSGIVSLIASFVLSYDAYILAGNPKAQFACDLNSVVSCGKVAQTWQAHLFGFPNAFIGLMAEPIVITIAVAGLSGASFKKWFMFTAQTIYSIGLIFALWLFYQSAFVIHVFCPWCLAVSIGTTITFFTLLRYNVLNDNLFLPESLSVKCKSFIESRGDTLVVLTIISIIVFIILTNYGFAVFGL